MKAEDQLELERPEMIGRRSATPDAGPKTILLHVQDDNSLDNRIQNALAVARTCAGHIDCLHVTPIQAYVAFDSFGGVFVMNDVIKTLDERETSLRARVEDELRNEDVSWTYTQMTGDVAGQLVSHAALADLLITGREPHRNDFADTQIGLIGELLCRLRTPILIPTEDGPLCDPTGPALIAWDGSYEAANAVRASIGMLKLAAEVSVLRVDEEKTETFPGTRLLEFLSRHGIHAELSVETAGKGKRDQAFVSGVLMSRAKALGAYLVMGGYNHSRLGEYIFGGVTRTMLKGGLVPIVIAR